MVYYSNVAEVRAAFQPMVGKAEYLSSSFAPDARLALQMASLRPSDRVLDLGTGCGEVIAAAKISVRDGLCVGLDAVEGFLNIDVPHRLARSGLTVAPAGSDAEKVHLIKGSVTDGALPNLIQQRVGQQQPKFDVIFALHVFNTIPPNQRRQALLTWKRLLADGGRMIVSMSARFGPNSGSIQGPAQFFTTTPLTEAPGCVVVISNSIHSTIQSADGTLLPERIIIAATQQAPDRLWQAARQQSQQAASAVGLRVINSHDIGKGNLLGLTHTVSSPPQATLDVMLPDKIMEWMNAQTIAGHQCWGRVHEALVRRITQGRNTMPADRRDMELVDALQRFSQKTIQNIDEQRAQIQAAKLLNASPNVAEHHQLGVLVELRV